jgi:hypothetical protein
MPVITYAYLVFAFVFAADTHHLRLFFIQRRGSCTMDKIKSEAIHVTGRGGL